MTQLVALSFMLNQRAPHHFLFTLTKNKSHVECSRAAGAKRSHLHDNRHGWVMFLVICQASTANKLIVIVAAILGLPQSLHTCTVRQHECDASKEAATKENVSYVDHTQM